MDWNTKIFTTPYTISRTGDSYPAVRHWIPPVGKWIQRQIKQDIKDNIDVGMFTIDAPTGASKFMLMASITQYIPAQQDSLIVVHRRDLLTQHSQDVVDLQEQGWITTNVCVMTYDAIVNVIKKINKGKRLNKKDTDIKNYLDKTSLVFFDEIHKYGKGEDVISLPSILEYMQTQSVKYVFGITATSKRASGWYKLIKHVCGVSDANAYFDRKYVYSKTQAAKEGVITLPEVVSVMTSLEVELGWGEFYNTDLASLQDKSVSELESMANFNWSETLVDTESFGLKKQLKNEAKNTAGFFGNTVYNHIREFIQNRFKSVIYMYSQSMFKNKPALVFVPQQIDADNAKALWDKHISDVECIVWHGSSEDFLENKGAAQKIKDRLNDQNDPLKVVILVGMWVEGTDLPFISQVHDCSFSPKGHDRTDQVKGRLRKGGHYFIYQDVLNSKKMSQQQLDNMIEVFGEDHDIEFYTAMAEAIEQSKEENDHSDQDGESKTDKDYMDQDTVNKNLEDLFPNGKPVIAGWIKSVHEGEPTAIKVPAGAFIKSEQVNLSKRMKIENFFEGFENA